VRSTRPKTTYVAPAPVARATEASAEAPDGALILAMLQNLS
jgi:hypothetical protein